MATKTYKTYSTRATPQSQPIPGSDQVANSAGGYSFALDEWKKLDRFLILGSEGGTYYIKERDLTEQNAENLRKLIAKDGQRVVERIVEVSDQGLAFRNDPALFALALCAAFGDEDTSKLARDVLPKVARIPTHLFHFMEFYKGFRGWGRGERSAIANWYLQNDSLAYHSVKYQSRDGWSNKDAIILSHPKPTDADVNAIFAWMIKGDKVDLSLYENSANLRIIWAFEQAKKAQTAKEIVDLISAEKLPRECIPTQFLNEVDVWSALLLNGMPITAMIRNLGKMTEVGLVKPMSTAAKYIAKEVTNQERLIKGRVHPLNLLVALKTYQQGHGEKGSLKWTPVREVVDALDAAFYLAFKAVEPTGKRLMLALDVSGSMTSPISSLPLSCCEAAAAMALVTANVEPNYITTVFSSAGTKFMKTAKRTWGDDGLSIFDISPRQRLDDVVRKTNNLPFGGTDCALPMLYAIQEKMDLDAFLVYTDSETWAGAVHPVQALQDYRQKFAREARLIVVGMTSNGFSIADPNDAGMLDVVGFSTDTPQVMSEFIKGNI